jgi:hypothetical protein
MDLNHLVADGTCPLMTEADGVDCGESSRNAIKHADSMKTPNIFPEFLTPGGLHYGIFLLPRGRKIWMMFGI